MNLRLDFDSLREMWIPVFVFGTLASLTPMVHAQSGACTRDINNLTVVDMCQTDSYTLGRVFISVTSSTMGDNSVCSCTLRGKTPSQNTATTFNFWQEGSSNYLCLQHHVTMVSWYTDLAGGLTNNQNFTCATKNTRISSPQSTSDVFLTQIRSDPATIFNYCLFLEPDRASDNNIELSCQSGPIVSSTSSTSITTTASTLITSTTPTPSTPSTASTESSTLSSPTSTDSSSAVATTGGESEVTSSDKTTSSPGALGSSDHTPAPSLLGGAIGGGVGGVALIIVIVVIVIVCKRRGRQSKPPPEERSGAVNRGYENVLTDNILYESSSGLANNQSTPSSQPTMSNGDGAYQSLDENGKSPSVTYYNTSGGLATVSTGNERERPIFGATNDYASVDEVTPRTSGAEPKRTSASPPAATPAAAAAAAAAAPSSAPPAPAPKPPTDQYAVVSKPPRQNKPAQNAEARSQSTNVTLPSGDVYAVVDRARNRGSEPTSPRSPPPEVAPPPAPAPDTTPGLVYADLDIVPSPRSSVESSAPPTDYAEIDHEASARL